MRHIGFYTLLLCSLIACRTTSITRISVNEQLDRRALTDDIPDCYDPLHYVPDTNTLFKTVRVNVHFVDAVSGDKNFNQEDGRRYMTSLIKNANKRLRENEKMNLPKGNDTPQLDPGYAYKISGSSGSQEDDGFYWHYDDEHYAFVHKGRHRNNYKKDVIRKYAINKDSIINIFVLPHHPDSVAASTYKAKRTGIALGTSLKMAGLYENPDKPWYAGSLLNHEIGHIFGLNHSWIENDGCDDTPPNPNCWEEKESGPCQGPISNNLMDYNNKQMAITPCQLGKIHRGFAQLHSRSRKLIEPVWCATDTNRTILIKGQSIWPGARDINTDIIIEKNASLKVYCRLSMSKNTKITVRPGGKLVLYNAELHNSCGDNWHGIYLEKKGSDEGALEVYGNTTIEDVYPYTQNP